MSDIQLFAVEAGGRIRPLPVPENATTFEALFAGLEFGVYSALRSYSQNKFLGLDEHIGRTVQSLVLLGWDYQLDEDVLRQALHTACSAYPHEAARVRFDVLAAPAAQLGTDSRLLIALIPFPGIPAHFYEKGVRVGIAESLTRETPLAKTAVFANARTKYSQYDPGSKNYEWLLLNEERAILEGTGSNFIGVRDGTILTARDGILEGVTLKIVLKMAAQLQIPVIYEPVPLDEIHTLDEAAMCSSSRALIPIVQIGDEVVGNGRPGPIVQQLLAAYREYVDEVVETAV